MKPLPKWVLPPTFPSVYDLESGTTIEMTAKVYGAMNTLINEYNKFADTVNAQLSTFTENESEARKDFETKIYKVMRDFQTCFTADFNVQVQNVIDANIEAGKLALSENYDPEAESLNIGLGG